MSSRARRSRSSRRAPTGTAGPSTAGERLRRQRRLHRDRGRRDTGLTLTANARYWAGKPAITTIELVTDIGGRSPVEVFEDGDLDYAPIVDFDASWIAYDETLGPQLREVPPFVVEYYGFDTSKPPFDDVRGAPGRSRWPSTGAGSPSSGRRRATRRRRPRWSRRASRAARTRTACPTHDPDAGPRAAREGRLPGRRRLPGDHDADRRRVVRRGDRRRAPARARDHGHLRDDGLRRLLRAAPRGPAGDLVAGLGRRLSRAATTSSGVLLGEDSTNNYGHWHDEAFDAAIADAGRRDRSRPPPTPPTTGPRRSSAREVPVFPMSYGTGWALSRDGLLGAGQNGLGNLRMAGLAWAD